MYIRKTTKHYKGKPYHNYLLVESVHTPKGPRQKVVCSLGKLDPGPAEKWLELASRVEMAISGQLSLEGEDKRVQEIVHKVKEKEKRREERRAKTAEVKIDEVEVEEAREAGPVHVGHQMWERLGVGEVLAQAGLSRRARALTEAMTLACLIQPCSEHAMPDWMRRTAIADILGYEVDSLAEDRLYRQLDGLHPARKKIEAALYERERNLFSLSPTVYLYDLTSTYFEGKCARNPHAKRGYSRDRRGDAKQVVVGLVLDGEGFPLAHEVFPGDRPDTATLADMLEALRARGGARKGTTVIVDRGMAYDGNLKEIAGAGYHYIVAARQKEREKWLSEFGDLEGFKKVERRPSPRNPCQKKSEVWVKEERGGGETLVLVRSAERKEKDRAIRELAEVRMASDLEKLSKSVERAIPKDPEKIHERIGRLRERYPRVARYFDISYDPVKGVLSFASALERRRVAEELDGAYLLRTDRSDLSPEEAWRLYMLLTRVERAFGDLKGPLSVRPVFHHLAHRTEAHIFLHVLAYHLLVAIEKSFLDRGIHTSWETVKDKLKTHQVVTVSLPTTQGSILKIRRATTPEPDHREIYEILGISEEPVKPKRTWVSTPCSD